MPTNPTPFGPYASYLSAERHRAPRPVVVPRAVLAADAARVRRADFLSVLLLALLAVAAACKPPVSVPAHPGVAVAAK